MLQGCLTALRHQVWPSSVGGSTFTIAVRTAKRKHLRIAARRKRENENKVKREKAAEVKEKPFVPYRIRLLMAQKVKVVSDEELAKWLKTPPMDDVWIAKYYVPRVCTALEAVSYHRELCHPSVLDAMESPLKLNLLLNMKGEKSKVIQDFQGLIALPFPPQELKVARSVVAICKTLADQEKAVAAGAEISGHMNVITAIEKGDLKLDAIDHLVCHVDSVLETTKLRGLLKKRMPDKKKGTLGSDITAMVSLFAKGFQYASKKDIGEELLTNLDFAIGRLDMTDEQITTNITAFIKTISAHRSLDLGPFINKAFLSVTSDGPRYRVDLSSFVPAAPVKKPFGTKKGAASGVDEPLSEDSGDTDEVAEKVAAIA